MLNSENFGHVMKATFLGHATVYLETSETKILIDPFLTGNPKAPLPQRRRADRR
jgi:L-ascorbate metabolism protein UlaG (beta-lactamase superfamily)